MEDNLLQGRKLTRVKQAFEAFDWSQEWEYMFTEHITNKENKAWIEKEALECRLDILSFVKCLYLSEGLDVSFIREVMDPWKYGIDPSLEKLLGESPFTEKGYYRQQIHLIEVANMLRKHVFHNPKFFDHLQMVLKELKIGTRRYRKPESPEVYNTHHNQVSAVLLSNEGCLTDRPWHKNFLR